MLVPPAAAAAGAGQECAEGAQRKLRPRADGAAHARRGRRLHAEGRHRGGARVHRLDDRQPAAGRRLHVRAAHPRPRARRSCSATSSRRAAASRDGEQVLDILAKHPSTARFIATKLARRFVSDTPPPALVDRVAARFRETDGDLREVMRTILTSPEFLVAGRVSREGQDAVRVRRQRAARASAPTSQDATPLVRELQQLGHAALHVPAADRLQGHGATRG